jgi:peptidoglycan hydrolase CwlO-like protein
LRDNIPNEDGENQENIDKLEKRINEMNTTITKLEKKVSTKQDLLHQR